MCFVNIHSCVRALFSSSFSFSMLKPKTINGQDMQDMYSEAIGKGAKFLEAPVSGSKVLVLLYIFDGDHVATIFPFYFFIISFSLAARYFKNLMLRTIGRTQFDRVCLELDREENSASHIFSRGSFRISW